MSIEKKYFGTLADGRVAHTYTITNKNGIEIKISDYGATIISIIAPDKEGRFSDIAMGFDSLADYDNAGGYLGAVVGRVAGRIDGGKFTLDGVEYSLYKNDEGIHHLHGGLSGFDAKIWDAEIIDEDEPSVVFSRIAPDGEEGYPGNLNVRVTYVLNNRNQLSISYEATTDKKTIISLTNHAYFNLGGYASYDIGEHILCLDADKYLRIGEDLIPTGEIVPVEGTPLDFRAPKALKDAIDSDHKDIVLVGGYDHTFVFSEADVEGPVMRAMVKHPGTGRTLKVYTDQPCIQLYSGNFLGDDKFPFKGGLVQKKQCAFCLETEKMPNSINHENFTDVTLDVGEKYEHNTIYEFGVEK